MTKHTESDKYDLVVIGGGAAGMVSTAVGSGMGARTLLVEKTDRLGGECSWTGCVPSKALLHLAFIAKENRQHGCPNAADDISEHAMEECRRITEEIARDAHSKDKLREIGSEILFSTDIKFTGEHELELKGEKIHARRVVIATGSSPKVPDIPGLAEAECLTNSNVFDLEKRPKSLTVIGGGPIGVELGQAFHRLGSKVTILGRNKYLLPKDDTELSGELVRILRDEGLDIKLSTAVEKVEVVNGLKRVHYTCDEDNCTVDTEHILVAAGRKMNVEGIGLENIGLDADLKGISVNKHRQTDQGWVYAAGDCDGTFQFSHVAEYEAIIAVKNALLPIKSSTDYKWMPWATFTEPELAHLGPTEEQLQEKSVKYRVYKQNFSADDRARADGVGVGMVKLLSSPTGHLLGAHILGPRAGELMNELVLAAKKGATLSDLSQTVHIYPTLNLAIQRAANLWFEDIADNPWIKGVLQLFTRRT